MRIINQLRNQNFNIIYLKYTNFKILLLTIMRQNTVVYRASALKSVLEMHEIQFIFFLVFFKNAKYGVQPTSIAKQCLNPARIAQHFKQFKLTLAR